MMDKSWTIAQLAEVTPEDFFGLIYKNKNHISRTFPRTLSGCDSLEKTRNFIADARSRQSAGDGAYFYIRSVETGALIGYVCVKNVDRHIDKCELAYFIDEDFEGRGITSAAVAETITYCFDVLRMNKIVICTLEINAASQRIAVRNGFRAEAVLRQEFKNGEGVLEDVVYFGLLKKDHDER